ncbi:MAG: LCP family protein [Actinomycetota bacterium]|nr:LCP family protein [Actinomycetota bacterium]
MKKRVLIVGACAVVLLLAIGATFALSTWGDVTRVSIDRAALPPSGEPSEQDQDQGEPTDDGPVAAETDGDGLDVFLMVGSDARDDLESTDGFGEFDGQRADVVMVLIRPADGSRAALLSLPRDLLVDDVCSSDREHKLNDSLEGCGTTLNGPSSLLFTVESVIGETIDHFALVDLAGFQEAVDAIGGYEICIPRAVRDQKADLELPAGCTHATGAQTLAWLRSRSTQELTDSGWRTMPGVNDLTRNERQRAFLLAMMGEISDFGSPKAVADVANVIAPYVTVDSELSLIDAVDLAWTLRGLNRGNIDELDIPVSDSTTADGAAVLVAQIDIAELVDEYLAPEIAGDPTGAFTG